MVGRSWSRGGTTCRFYIRGKGKRKDWKRYNRCSYDALKFLPSNRKSNVSKREAFRVLRHHNRLVLRRVPACGIRDARSRFGGWILKLERGKDYDRLDWF